MSERGYRKVTCAARPPLLGPCPARPRPRPITAPPRDGLRGRRSRASTSPRSCVSPSSRASGTGRSSSSSAALVCAGWRRSSAAISARRCSPDRPRNGRPGCGRSSRRCATRDFRVAPLRADRALDLLAVAVVPGATRTSPRRAGERRALCAHLVNQLPEQCTGRSRTAAAATVEVPAEDQSDRVARRVDYLIAPNRFVMVPLIAPNHNELVPQKGSPRSSPRTRASNHIAPRLRQSLAAEYARVRAVRIS